MQRRETGALVEAGFLTALVIILSLLITLAPVLAIVGNFFWPVPIAVLGLRHGAKWSILSTVAAFILLSFFAGPLVALLKAGTFGVVGILLGMGFRNEWGHAKRLLFPAIVFFLSIAAQFTAATYIMGIDIIGAATSTYETTLASGLEAYRQSGMTEEQIAMVKATMDAQMTLIKTVLPAGLFLSGLTMSYLNNILTGAVLRRMGEPVIGFPPFIRWEMPSWTVYVFVLSWVMVYWGMTRSIPYLYEVGANLQTFSVYLLWIQGLAFMYYLMEKVNLHKGVRIFVIVLSLLVPVVQQLALGMGLFDLVTRYRAKRDYTT